MYKSLADDFGEAVLEDDLQTRKKFREALNKRLKELREKTTENPMQWAIKEAEKQIASENKKV